MGHPRIDNETPYAFDAIHVADEENRPIVVPVIKATYQFDLKGVLRLHDKQDTVNFGGEPWTDKPISSYKYEPETAFHKMTTDIALIGHAHSPNPGATQIDVGLKVGPVQKMAKVFGDRYWVQTTTGASISKTAPIKKIPLNWEHAFGGSDSLNSTPERPKFEVRNPVGTGFGSPLEKSGDKLKLPNIEDPKNLLKSYGDVVPPCGFGFTLPNWHPRANFAGTYDETWNSERKPKLPVDFDRRYFSAAAPGLMAPAYLKGGEDIVLLNVTASQRVAFRLPRVPSPHCRVFLRGQKDQLLRMNLDTVIINTDENKLHMLWRAFTFAGAGPHDVTAIEIASSR